MLSPNLVYAMVLVLISLMGFSVVISDSGKGSLVQHSGVSRR